MLFQYSVEALDGHGGLLFLEGILQLGKVSIHIVNVVVGLQSQNLRLEVGLRMPEEININQTSIEYDLDYPFEKYYNVATIIGAINKYISKEWNHRTLANWCCIYNWILGGGFKEDVKEFDKTNK